MPKRKPFSKELSDWLKSSEEKTLAGVSDVFGEKSFAICFLILMAAPALPIPTGGITHVFEVVVLLLALELIAGRDEIWLPKQWRAKKLSPALLKKALPFLARKIQWLEKYSRPRFSGFMRSPSVGRVAGLLVFILTLGAFISPPFSGLDTLPSLGVVLIALSLILEDFALLLGGMIIGSLGLVLYVMLGNAVFQGIKTLL